MKKLDLFRFDNTARRIIEELSRKGAAISNLYGWNLLEIEANKKKIIVSSEDLSNRPYIYHVLFSDRKGINEFLMRNKFVYTFDNKCNSNLETWLVLTFSDGFYNILRIIPGHIIGDGKVSLKELIIVENLRRLNLCDSYLNLISLKKVDGLDIIPQFGEKIILKNIRELDEGAEVELIDCENDLIKRISDFFFRNFPDLEYFTFRLIIDRNNPHQPFRINNITLNVKHNIFFPIHRNGNNYDPARKIAENLLNRLKRC